MFIFKLGKLELLSCSVELPTKFKTDQIGYWYH